MTNYLAVTPGELQSAARFTRQLAHVAYRIGPDSTLLRQPLLLQTKGGVLSVSDTDAPPLTDPDAFRAAVLRECDRRSYTGVLLDFESSAAPDRAEAVRRLWEALRRSRKALYVPESYAAAAAGATVLVGTAVSGGSLAQRLSDAVRQYGPGRVALDVERLRMDFLLPAPSGVGTPLTGEELRRLTDREAPSVFFSQDLCARYFTYTERTAIHFVLYDDAGTISRKLRMGADLGCPAAFIMYPEVSDLLGELFPPGRQ